MPQSLKLMLGRLIDFCFASQARKDLEVTRLSHEMREGAAPVMVVHLVYEARGEMVGQKMFDFSADAIEARWQAGREAMARLLAALPPMPSARMPIWSKGLPGFPNTSTHFLV